MKQPTTINLVFTIDREDAEISREYEREWLEDYLCDSDDSDLSLNDNRFIISYQYWYKPELFRKKIYLKYKIEVEAEKDDDNFTPEELCSYIYKNLSRPKWPVLKVKNTDISIFSTR